MTKKYKIKSTFLENPATLKYEKIISFLKTEWYEEKTSKSSHRKVLYSPTGAFYTVAVHNNDVKDYQKRGLRDFYISNLNENENNQ